MHIKGIQGKIILLITSIIWGFAFVAQSKVASYVDTFTLNFLRCFIGAIVLIPLIIVNCKKNKTPIFEANSKDKKHLIFAGFICAIFLCVGMSFQQFGISIYPEEAAASGRSGFITALYVVLVPLISVFLKRKLHLNSIISCILATIGLYLLCFSKGIDHIYIGDFIVLISAFGFALQILCIDKYSSSVNAIKLSFIQFIFCGLFSMILMLIFENPNISKIIEVILPILYLGGVSSGIGYTLQIIGQKLSNNPTIDSIIMSLESLFAVIGGAIILNEKLLTNEIIGCILMFIAIIIAQLPILAKKTKS